MLALEREAVAAPRDGYRACREIARVHSKTFFLSSLFLSLEGFPEDGMQNPEAFKQFVREHHVESFLEYSEYEGVTVKEIKRALKVEEAFSAMLDAMQ